MAQLYSIDGGHLKLNLHEGQSEIWDAAERFLFMIAGTQGGKTSFGPWWLAREIYGGSTYWPLPDDYHTQGRGKGDYLAVTSSFELFKLKMLPETLNVFEHILRIGRYGLGDKILELKDPTTGEFWAQKSSDPMWGRVILRSAAAKSGLESATARAAWLDEVGQDEFTLSAWEAVQRRLTLAEGRVLGTTTPYNLGWLKQQIFDRRGRADMRVVQFASTVNPTFPRQEFERARETMVDWKFRMFYLGQFERPAGMIYSDFVDKRREHGGHKVEPFDIPTDWPRYLGVDPGLENQGRVWLAHDIQHDILYVYRAERPDKKSTSEHAADVRATAQRHQENVVILAVGTKSEEQQRLDWRNEGLPVADLPFHDVESGIDRVIRLLRQWRIFFFEDDGDNGMTRLFDEIGTYKRKLDENDQPTAEIEDKKKYHLLDGLRYGVAATGEAYEDAGGINQAEQYRVSSSSY
jgi:hypothetical protein